MEDPASPPAQHQQAQENDDTTTTKASEKNESTAANSNSCLKTLSSEGETNAAAASAPPPRKKARTAYFIFMEEKRSEVVAAHPGEKLGGVARIIGRLWSSLPPAEKEVYRARAAAERAALPPAPNDDTAPAGAAAAAVDLDAIVALPVGRIRRIARIDPEVRMINREATLLLTKCAELFTARLATDAVAVAGMRNRRKLLPEDVAELCSTREHYAFLREDVRDLLRDQAEERRRRKEETTTTDDDNHRGANDVSNGGNEGDERERTKTLDDFWKVPSSAS